MTVFHAVLYCLPCTLLAPSTTPSTVAGFQPLTFFLSSANIHDIECRCMQGLRLHCVDGCCAYLANELAVLLGSCALNVRRKNLVMVAL